MTSPFLICLSTSKKSWGKKMLLKILGVSKTRGRQRGSTTSTWSRCTTFKLRTRPSTRGRRRRTHMGRNSSTTWFGKMKQRRPRRPGVGALKPINSTTKMGSYGIKRLSMTLKSTISHTWAPKTNISWWGITIWGLTLSNLRMTCLPSSTINI